MGREREGQGGGSGRGVDVEEDRDVLSEWWSVEANAFLPCVSFCLVTRLLFGI